MSLRRSKRSKFTPISSFAAGEKPPVILMPVNTQLFKGMGRLKRLSPQKLADSSNAYMNKIQCPKISFYTQDVATARQYAKDLTKSEKMMLCFMLTRDARIVDIDSKTTLKTLHSILTQHGKKTEAHYLKVVMGLDMSSKQQHQELVKFARARGIDLSDYPLNKKLLPLSTTNTDVLKRMSLWPLDELVFGALADILSQKEYMIDGLRVKEGLPHYYGTMETWHNEVILFCAKETIVAENCNSVLTR